VTGSATPVEDVQMRRRKTVLGAGLALVLCSVHAYASTIVLRSCYTGDCAALPSDFEVRLTLTDVTRDFGSGDLPALQIDSTAGTSTGVGVVSSVFLDFGRPVGALPWVFAIPSGDGPSQAAVNFPKKGSGTAAGGHPYNLELDFHPPKSPGAGMLAPGGAVRFTIAGLSSSSFAAAYAHVQRIGPNESGSAHIAKARVPEGLSTLTAFGLALAALRLLRRRHRD
jgi:hypothetical protein